MPKPVGVKDECPKGRDAPAARLAKAALEEAGFECHLGRPTFDHYRCRAAGALTGEHRNHFISRSIQLNLTARKGVCVRLVTTLYDWRVQPEARSQ